jgi:hypothetical protein
MDTVTLPFLSVKTPLKLALEAMKREKRSAVVARDDDRCWLYKAGWIAVEMAQGERILADVERRRKVDQASPREMASRGINLLAPHDTYHAVEQYLDQVGKSYMLAAPLITKDETITIITRHEGLTVEISSGPTGYYCTNPNLADDPHPYLPPPLPHNLLCVIDGSPIVPVG